jgi:hypothetical protein
MRTLLLALAALTLATSAVAQTPTPVDTKALLAANTRPFSYADGKLPVPGRTSCSARLKNSPVRVPRREPPRPRDPDLRRRPLQPPAGRARLSLPGRRAGPLGDRAVNSYRGDLSRIVALSKALSHPHRLLLGPGPRLAGPGLSKERQAGRSLHLGAGAGAGRRRPIWRSCCPGAQRGDQGDHPGPAGRGADEGDPRQSGRLHP